MISVCSSPKRSHLVNSLTKRQNFGHDQIGSIADDKLNIVEMKISLF